MYDLEEVESGISVISSHGAVYLLQGQGSLLTSKTYHDFSGFFNSEPVYSSLDLDLDLALIDPDLDLAVEALL